MDLEPQSTPFSTALFYSAIEDILLLSIDHRPQSGPFSTAPFDCANSEVILRSMNSQMADSYNRPRSAKVHPIILPLLHIMPLQRLSCEPKKPAAKCSFFYCPFYHA